MPASAIFSTKFASSMVSPASARAKRIPEKGKIFLVEVHCTKKTKQIVQLRLEKAYYLCCVCFDWPHLIPAT